MPSRETTETPKDYYPAEVEDLVAAINRTLQLKTRPYLSCVCAKQQRRVTPYTLPNRTMCRKSDKENSLDSSCKICRLKNPKSPAAESDDPYEMLQDLLREGGLIKEAVKRIQLGINTAKPVDTNYYDLEELEVKSPRLCEV